MSTKILVSVAWPYANGDLHVGHLAGAYLPADIFARYHRLAGNDVLMVSGTDSHGTAITVRAEKEGITAREVFERYHRRFVETQLKLGISYDLYTHTDTANHEKVAQDIFLNLLNKGLLYTEVQKQFYSETLRRFLPDRYVEGICPHCGYKEARGDQCDNCGRLLDALELGSPRCKIDGSVPVIRETEHFFFDLPKLEPAVLDYLNREKDHWRPNVIKFSRNYVQGGLKGRAITRDLDWGIPLPLKDEKYEGKRIYVWFEAVMGYLTASIEWARRYGQTEQWRDWWYDPAALTYYFLGKDNIPFHTVIWPAELIGVDSLYEERPERHLNLPYDVPANEFMNIEGNQASKSRNWAIWVPDILNRYDPDAIRFYMASVLPESNDSDFSWNDFVQRNNNELVATWGNLAHRVLSFTYKHFGAVPEPGELDDIDRALLAQAEAAFEAVGRRLAAVQLRAALAEALALAREANRYLDVKAPWFQIKTDRAAAATSLYVVLRVIDSLKVLLAPFLPFSAERLHRTLGYTTSLFGELIADEVSEGERSYPVLCYKGGTAAGRWAPSQLPAGQALQKPDPLFTKLEESVAVEEQARLGA